MLEYSGTNKKIIILQLSGQEKRSLYDKANEYNVEKSAQETNEKSGQRRRQEKVEKGYENSGCATCLERGKNGPKWLGRMFEWKYWAQKALESERQINNSL